MTPFDLENLYAIYRASTGVTTDTRSIAKGNIFFALKGEKFNANLFAEQALLSGASHVVVDEIANPLWVEQYNTRFVLVENVLLTLQKLAGLHRSKLKCPVLAITGSNGKTTTKELVAAVLSRKFSVHATKGNFNNHIGIPLTLLAIQPDTQFAVIEMGANHQREIASYCEYVKPDYGLITNVGLAHLEGFGGVEGVIKGKTELYAHLATYHGSIFVSAQNEILLQKAVEFGFDVSDVTRVITYGKSGSAYCIGELKNNAQFLAVLTDGVQINTNLVGDYNFENVMSAVCIGKYFGVDMPQIKEAIENYLPSNNRSQQMIIGTNRVILDAYNANPSSLSEALKNFETIESPNKVVILGEMMELGQYAATEHEKILAIVEAMHLLDRVFVGKGFEFVKSKGKSNIHWFEKTEEAKAWFHEQKFQDTDILIKGSRKNELEKVLKD